jgi:AMP nucleosidase
MPAYHLMAEDGMGITLINIGVGPSNAKTITDHIAVLRSHCWLMLGHCGGLRSSQILGDFVLAHAYLRDDQVLDDVLPPDIPLPTIAEVQIALTEAIGDVMELSGREMKRHVRTGTVVTTDDRNWEMRYAALRPRLNQSRAIAIDMESATIAANGYRFRVPYGTLLCVSGDKITRNRGGVLSLSRCATFEYWSGSDAHSPKRSGKWDFAFEEIAQPR